MKKKTLKIAHLSDTHGLHRSIKWDGTDFSQADVLVHSGDFSMLGKREEVETFLNWWRLLPVQYKVLVAGNHDLTLDPKFRWVEPEDGKYYPWLQEALDRYTSFYGHYYLENEGVEIEGINFWGSPYSKWFHGDRWAFNVKDDPNGFLFWSNIPMNTDVLITHGPPLLFLDQVYGGENTGSTGLLDRVNRVKPLLHMFGHIHEAYGFEGPSALNIHYSNGSICDLQYKPINAPRLMEVDFEERTVKILNHDKQTRTNHSPNGEEDQRVPGEGEKVPD